MALVTEVVKPPQDLARNAYHGLIVLLTLPKSILKLALKATTAETQLLRSRARLSGASSKEVLLVISGSTVILSEAQQVAHQAPALQLLPLAAALSQQVAAVAVNQLD